MYLPHLFSLTLRSPIKHTVLLHERKLVPTKTHLWHLSMVFTLYFPSHLRPVQRSPDSLQDSSASRSNVKLGFLRTGNVVRSG